MADQDRYSAEGYTAYWEGVDKTARYFDSVMLKKHEKEKIQKKVPGSLSQRTEMSERFRWQNPALNIQHEEYSFRKLPAPPRSC